MLMRANNVSLLAGFLISLALHLLVIAPLLAMAMTRSPSSRSLLARFDPEMIREPPEEEEPKPEEELQLGIEESVTSTVTWIGYEEYQQHLARLSEVEQAALTDDPAGGAPLTAPPVPPPVPEQPQAPAAAEAPEEAEQQMAAASPTEPVLPASVDEHLMLLTGPEGTAGQLQERTNEATAATESPGPDEPATQDPDASQAWLMRLLETLRKAAEQMQAQANPQPSRPATPAPPQPQPAQSGLNQGDQADKESDPTSTIEVPMDQIEAGKPLAARGLELKPRKPEFTHLILLTAAPGNPLVEIRFASTGIPAFARIIQSSGDKRVDEFLLDSLYRWKAEGKPLTELKDKETIDVVIRIILNPRSRR
ncbi:MAG: hypothetical protein JSV91_15980 [Phycisphaerales bacterium]|nr:MAG: hypothetical protein JSV91_15980 [Phycisphaerales bacterium]